MVLLNDGVAQYRVCLALIPTRVSFIQNHTPPLIVSHSFLVFLYLLLSLFSTFLSVDLGQSDNEK